MDFNTLMAKQSHKGIFISCNRRIQVIDFRYYPLPDLQTKYSMPYFIAEKLSSGLGLFICKELIEKYNGKITYRIDDDEICFIIEFMNQESQAAKQIHQNNKINASA